MTTNQLIWIVGILLIFAAVMVWFWEKMEMDLLEDETEFLMEKKTDKEKLIALLQKANIEFEEWNEYMMTWDDGYVEATFDLEGRLKDIRTRHVSA
tara:strand:+ start:929 stop:1216 length:288 start_codon:yes stop_codon:yes gene_type:complete